MAESHREEIAKLEALYASNPGGRVFVHLAEAYRKAGEHDRARRILNEGLERHADSASAYVVLGRVLADAGEDNEAQTAFRRVLELDGGNLVALRWLGDLARKSGRPGEARSYYRDLLARNPNNNEIQDLLASVEDAADAPQETFGVPGRTDQQTSAEPEFGIVQLDDLPGDLGAFAGVAPPRDQSVEETSLEEALGIEHTFDEEEPEPLALEHFEAQITEEPLDETILESSLEIETFGSDLGEEQTDEPELPVDLSDMNVPQEEPEEEYMAGSFDLSGFEEPADETEPETQPLDTGGLNEAAEFEAPTYADDLPTLYSPDEDTAPPIEEPQTDGPAAFETPLEYAALEEEPEPIEFPGEGTEDTPAETLLEAVEPALEPTTFSAEPPTEPFYEPFVEPQAEAGAEPEAEAQPEVEPESYSPEPAWSATPEPETYSAEPDYVSPAEPPEPFVTSDPLQAASEELESEPITEEQWAETGAAEAVPLEGMESAFSDVVGGAAAEEDDGLVTETMAELYRAQGFGDRAADVYRTLLRRRPGDARLAAKLEELEASLAVPQVESVFEEDESGEVWLRGVGTAWTGTMPPATPEPETPYAWTEAEEASAGEPVASFLRSIVQWRPTQASRAPAEAEPETLLLDEQAHPRAPEPWTPATPAPAEPEQPQAWTPPEAAPAPPDPWGQTPTPPAEPWGGPPAATAPEPWAAPPTPPAADPWSTPQTSTPVEDPWSAAPPSQEPWTGPVTPPATPDPWAAPANPSAGADPWAPPATPQAPEPWAQQPPAPPAAPAEPWAAPPPAPEPWAAQSEPAPGPSGGSRSSSSPVEAAFDAWYSPARDTPAPPPPAPTPPPAPAPAPAAEQEEPGREGEDEDLEMFRSWLQSLKK